MTSVKDITTRLARAAAKRSLAKDSASRVQSGARSSYAEAQPVFAGTVKTAPTARSGRLVLTLLIALLTTATAWAEYGGGTGTKDDPYRISGSYDLSTFANNVNNGYNYEDNYFVQTADINLATSSYWLGLPIGKDADNPFKGHYDGGGYTISGLTITTDGEYAGLFGYIKGGTYHGSETNTSIAEVHGVVLVNPTVTVTATSSSQYAGAVVGLASDCARLYDNTVIGGTVTATGNGGDGIWSDGTITLGWTDYADRITASSYNGTVRVKTGQALVDGNGNILSGTLAASDINGKKLSPALLLADAASNTTAIGNFNGKEFAAVQLSGRTLTKDGNWNTLCLPFSMTAAQIAASDLAGATIKELNASTSSLAADGTLTLYFTTVTAIEAGKPYIVKWESTGSVTDPTFPGVTISSTAATAVGFTNNATTGQCQFVGQYSPFSIGDTSSGTFDGDLSEIIMLGANSKLGYSQNARTLKCFRAHFYVPADPATGNQIARRFVIDFGDNETTGIRSLSPDPSPEGEGNLKGEGSGYFTLDGRRISGKPTKPGLYIVNGKKVVIK